MVTDMHTSLPSLEEIWAWLDSVNDPEIPILSVVDLGIVRNVRFTKENEGSPATDEQELVPTVVVTVTPTYSGCPAMAVIKTDIQRALEQRGIGRVRVETQLSPAWTTDWMTERGRQRLREYGIAPPEPQAANPSTLITCPRCGSSDTRLVSRFGSTPCKAFYICNSCLEPFDYFKCH
ncbi:MAG: phenylacetate-CoA oxygenase subunit PaaJ [Verrucomicrobia bacterium]|nr:phenylacetate-CoA oxygenase subunit PaaJ [Verrucomicrobiota bacterium]